jgi:hypothetical protein
MSRPGENVTEFRFEHAGSDAQVMMCGPGAAVVFSQARGLAHALRIGRKATPAAANGLNEWLIQAASVPESEGQHLDGRRLENPVYQELVRHELTSGSGRGICALLTGSCFDHHFSAVFGLGPDRDAPECIVFEIDVADRCRGQVEMLAATYTLTGADLAIAPSRATPSSLTWNVGGGVLELEACAPAIIDEPSSTSEGMRVQIQALINPQTHTQRLHYRWRWAS